MLRLLVSGLLLFCSLGIFLAHLLCLRLGLTPDYLSVGLGALAITVLVVCRSLPILGLLGALTLAANLPDPVLADYGVDRDLLLVLLLCLMIFPFVQRSLNQ